MAVDSKHRELEGLKIDRSAAPAPGPSRWAKVYILAGVSVFVLLGLAILAYRLIAGSTPEVEVVRAAAEGGAVGGVTLTATGYIVPHHKINVNSKVTGRVKWIGVEKGDNVREGQVLVKLEDDEFRAQYEQARGASESARAYLDELEHGSRPEEVAEAEHNLEEARATLVNDKLTLTRTRELAAQGVVSKQTLDDATAKYDSDQQRVNSLEKAFQLAKIGPRPEEIQRAKGALAQAAGQAAYAKSLLDATVIRAPVNGTILERTAEKGELITAQFASSAEGGPQGSVVSLADLKDIQADLDIAQDDFAKLNAHQKAIVTVDAFPDLKWNGVIAEISPEANRQKATVEVKVQILNPDSHLRPEMNTTVRFLADEPKSGNSQAAGAYVPTGALRENDGRKFVFLAFDGKAIKREVKVLSQRSGGALVSGLNGGETVITTAPDGLKDGTKIKIKGQS
ncbi:MAG: efflux RND transporter periplasmic adaptor subunit [Acidobacteria bacterium]|nr:efflux RND transporter periplasmic adaptor subunit [Acidobacteriota bacterium]MBV9624305.1 efflux RND transporter periplasmic adaptor subunit [Acidobacteriota bacterium]